MQDRQKPSSIFNFKKLQIKFLKVCLLFFLPVVILYSLAEYAAASIPNVYSVTGKYLNENKKEFEVAIFGSSQIKNSVNIQFLDKSAINLSSTGQHHNTDFGLLTSLRDSFPNLKTVVFEVSFGHFEIPHNSVYFWKHAPFLKYYNANLFNRKTYFSDKWLLKSNPGVLSEIMYAYAVKDVSQSTFNKYGFEYNFFEGKFKNLNYNEGLIIKKPFVIGNTENLKIFKYNVSYFYTMLNYCEKEKLNVLIISPPTYHNYVEKRNPNIVRRRDSIIDEVLKKYPNAHYFNDEEDADMVLRDFRNENHMSPNGAKKFTIKLNDTLNNIYNYFK